MLQTMNVTISIASHKWIPIIVFLWFYLFFTVLRVYLQISKKIFFKIRYILMILLIFGAFLTYETGRLGGLLVHKFGAGTELILGN